MNSSKPTTWQSLRAVVGSWRLLSVVLLSFSSGLPLGLVWIAIPAWMARAGVDIKVIGLFSLAQAPWSFKLLWSPSMDAYPLPFLGRKRGWILVSQVALVALGLGLSAVSDEPRAVWVIGSLALAIAFASATQDIAIDAYAVEVLRPEEHGIAVGARVALYRAAMLVSGGVSITLAAETSWTLVNALLALAYVPLMLVTWFAPEPEAVPGAPRTLREAVWGPLVGFLAQHRALEILAFVVLYKLSDNLSQALIRPFLVQAGYRDFDVGVATATIGQTAAVAGTVLGGVLTQALGLGRALWVFGFLQVFANLGYAAVAEVGVNRPLMYGAQALELGTSGMAAGAFGVLLLRLTQKRFSATQYALLSSLFTLPRILCGPLAGVLADAIGWRDFFVFSVFMGIPGLVLLARFVPWGAREPEFQAAVREPGAPLSRAAMLVRAAGGALAGAALGLLAVGIVGGLASRRAGRGFDFGGAVHAALAPQRLADWTTAAGVTVLALGAGLATAAALVARGGRGEGAGPSPDGNNARPPG
ncbi:MAG TPA: MFS transporter [Vicinamibacteria bacterium]|nr:MFS transporter [Vicinamibacteria bacterium]